ncbi:hypothetical protein TrLO_g2675 [Triparma laevis f. longispina]|uniref:DUF4116 domain-containing protein n=1 Tax=Triparma laevis f. longispina TaxID=1714387 RepID=A0A9W7EHE0_9STRA|nr:hypothetical protein TrLO_g2675 [Triparma laevis f. longispina]
MIARLLASRQSPPLRGRCDARTALPFCSTLCTLKPKGADIQEGVFRRVSEVKTEHNNGHGGDDMDDDSDDENDFNVNNAPTDYLPLGPTTKSTIAMAYSHDGLLIATTHGDHTVKVISCIDWTVKAILKGHPRTPWCVKFHPSDSNTLVSGCLGYQCRIWDVESGSCLYMTKLTNSVISLSFHPTEKIVLGACGNELSFWEWEKNKLNKIKRDDQIRCVMWTESGNGFVIGEHNRQEEGEEQNQQHTYRLNLCTHHYVEDGKVVVTEVGVIRKSVMLYNDGGIDIKGRDILLLCHDVEGEGRIMEKADSIAVPLQPPVGAQGEGLTHAEVLSIVTADGDALMNHKEFSDDPIIVTAAAKSSVDALLWASERLKSDRTVMLEAVTAHGRAIRYTQTLRNDPEIALAAVTNDGDALQMCGSLRSDKVVVFAAVKQSPWALAYASEDLRADVDVVLAAVRGDKGAVQCAATSAVQHPSVVRAIAEEKNSSSMFSMNWMRRPSNEGSGGAVGTPPRDASAEGLSSPPNMSRGGSRGSNPFGRSSSRDSSSSAPPMPLDIEERGEEVVGHYIMVLELPTLDKPTRVVPEVAPTITCTKFGPPGIITVGYGVRLDEESNDPHRVFSSFIIRTQVPKLTLKDLAKNIGTGYMEEGVDDITVGPPGSIQLLHTVNSKSDDVNIALSNKVGFGVAWGTKQGGVRIAHLGNRFKMT